MLKLNNITTYLLTTTIYKITTVNLHEVGQLFKHKSVYKANH